MLKDVYIDMYQCMHFSDDWEWMRMARRPIGKTSTKIHDMSHRRKWSAIDGNTNTSRMDTTVDGRRPSILEG
eukprot:scaffold63911_cov67-Cyclotella_meneghiniana.AAC.5